MIGIRREAPGFCFGFEAAAGKIRPAVGGLTGDERNYRECMVWGQMWKGEGYVGQSQKNAV